MYECRACADAKALATEERYMAWARPLKLAKVEHRWCRKTLTYCLCAIGAGHNEIPDGDHVTYWRKAFPGPWNRLTGRQRQVVCITSEPYQSADVCLYPAITGVELVIARQPSPYFPGHTVLHEWWRATSVRDLLVFHEEHS